MENKKRLALEIGLVLVILYLWQSRCKKNKSVEQAKDGADVTSTTPVSNTNQTSQCASERISTDKKEKSQLGKTLTIVQ